MNAYPGPLPESIRSILAVDVSATADFPSELVTHRSELGWRLGTSLIIRMSDPSSQAVCSIKRRVGPLFRRLIWRNLVIAVELSSVPRSVRLIRHHHLSRLAVFPGPVPPEPAMSCLKATISSGAPVQFCPRCPIPPQLQPFPDLSSPLQSLTWWPKAKQRRHLGDNSVCLALAYTRPTLSRPTAQICLAAVASRTTTAVLASP